MRKKKGKKTVNTFLAASLATTSIVAPTITVAEDLNDLIISEYIEGSSNNKAIELYNGTGAEIDLSQYTLELYSNGSTTATKLINLSGTLKSGETYVLVNNQANDDIKSKADLEDSSVINFNGDDALVLKKADVVVDSIGQVGEQVKNLNDVTLLRNIEITTGDTITVDVFDPSKEWTKRPKDDSSNLGIHGTGNSTPEEPPVEEPSVEISPIAGVRNMDLGTKVTIKGVVAADLKNTFSVQDSTGGIAVRPTSFDMSEGDEVTLTGTLAEYRGLLQLDGATVVEKTKDVGVPAPKEVTGAEVAEGNESQLVVAKNIELISVEDGGSWANYTATDGTNEFIVRDENNNLGLAVGSSYESITGIVQQFDDNYQVIPRSLKDIVVDSSIIQPVLADPGTGTVVGGTTVTLTTNTANAEILYTLDGTDPIENGESYTTPIKILENKMIKAVVKTEDGRFSEIKTFEYKITDSLQIHDIQGESHNSPMDGETVSDIEGIVTYTYELGGNHYFHMQTPDDKADDNANTSEGIVVFTGNRAADVKIGDLVNVAGTVDEYHIDGYYDTKAKTDLPVTQINARTDRGGVITVVQSNVELPQAIAITNEALPNAVIDNDGFAEFDPKEDAIDFWESLEGMRVEVGNVKAVAPQEHGDLITVLEGRATDTNNGGVLLTEKNANSDRIQFKLYDNNEARDFEVATGDQFTGPIQGVVNYGFQNYKIYSDYEVMKTKHIEGEAAPETTTIVKDDNKVTIASYNLENFSNNTSETSNDKAQKLARAFAQDMQSPDIIGVTEVQDNNGADSGDAAANESYERLIEAIVAAGGPRYAYANIDPENNQDGGAPNANIRVGFLYNPERVSLTKDIPAGDATTAVGYENGKLTHNPGRIDPTNAAFENSRKPLAAQFDFQGESVIIIVNHWNSKTGDTPLFGSTQPPVYGSEEQRHKIANVLNNFVEEIKADNPDANIISLGDFNDFQFTESLKIHEGQNMTNMINMVEASDRYTYLFQGNSQVLDHILVSDNLAESTEVDILHINADFTDMAGRASDHDPVMVQVDLTASTQTEQPPLFQYKTNKLKVSQIAQYDSREGAAGTEILAYDAEQQKAFVTNGAVAGFDILSFSNLESGKFTRVASEKRVLLSDFGITGVADITSIASHPNKDLIAIAAVSDPKTNNGYIVFANKNGEYLSHVKVGALPDMVTFTPDGTKALVANEGEPSDDYSVDPAGSISIIDVTGKPNDFVARELKFTEQMLDENVRVTSKGTKLAQLEPEYITVTADSKTAYVSLQENNAIATIDLTSEVITSVKGLGIKDHSAPGNELDAIKEDKAAKLEKQPILAFYMPDAIDTFTVGEKIYLVTPNEGDARDYKTYSEEADLKDIIENLDLKADNYEGYTQAELDELLKEGLGDLVDYKVTLENGLNGATGKYEAIYGFGGRSFTIFDADTMDLIFDSGSDFEKITSVALPEYFNTDNEEIKIDNRSDNKGPEPETSVIGTIDGKTYAFIALERTSAIMVYDLSNPSQPKFVTLISSRDFSEDIKGDVSPEGLQFISAEESPTGKALLAATHEISGTVAVYEFSKGDGKDNEEDDGDLVTAKTFNITNHKTRNLTLSSPGISVALDRTNNIEEGITITSSESAELTGEGLEDLTVTIKPANSGAIVDFSGATVGKVIIDGTNVAKIRGAENIQSIVYKNDAKPENIAFTDSEGAKIDPPSEGE